MTIAAPTRLNHLRSASRAMLDGYTPEQQRRQSHPQLSPLLWHVGHVFFVETYWLQERVFGDTRMTDRWRCVYVPEACTKSERGGRLPDADALREWSVAVSQRNDEYWAEAAGTRHPLLDDGYLAAFLCQHYAQHLETMRLAAVQLRLAEEDAAATDIMASAPQIRMRAVNAHTLDIGTAGIEAYDNEKPRFQTRIEAFEIAEHPVSNAEWLGFLQTGGYDDARYWDADGWFWRLTNDVCHPQHWRPFADGRWQIPADTTEPVARQPVHGIGWYEARAFARYADARLPDEIEWETARRADMLAGRDQVWEWCSNAFAPYSGFSAFPYDGYSCPWFDGAHFVARGASRLSEPDIRRPGFRNFFPPGHRHVHAGLRLAR